MLARKSITAVLSALFMILSVQCSKIQEGEEGKPIRFTYGDNTDSIKNVHSYYTSYTIDNSQESKSKLTINLSLGNFSTGDRTYNLHGFYLISAGKDTCYPVKDVLDSFKPVRKNKWHDIQLFFSIGRNVDIRQMALYYKDKSDGEPDYRITLSPRIQTVDLGKWFQFNTENNYSILGKSETELIERCGFPDLISSDPAAGENAKLYRYYVSGKGFINYHVRDGNVYSGITKALYINEDEAINAFNEKRLSYRLLGYDIKEVSQIHFEATKSNLSLSVFAGAYNGEIFTLESGYIKTY